MIYLKSRSQSRETCNTFSETVNIPLIVTYQRMGNLFSAFDSPSEGTVSRSGTTLGNHMMIYPPSLTIFLKC